MLKPWTGFTWTAWGFPLPSSHRWLSPGSVWCLVHQGQPCVPRRTTWSGFRVPTACPVQETASASFPERLGADSGGQGSGSVLSTQIVWASVSPSGKQEKEWPLASCDAAGTAPHSCPQGTRFPAQPCPSPLSVVATTGQGRMGGARGGAEQDRWTVPSPPACCLRGGRGGVLRDPVSTNVSFPRRGRRGRGGEGPI